MGLGVAPWDDLPTEEAMTTILPERVKDRIRELEQELEKSKAENERLVKRFRDEFSISVNNAEEMREWKARAEKAEAQLVRQRPLIDAAMGAGIMTTKDGAGISFNFFTNEDDKRSILRAALAYREGEK